MLGRCKCFFEGSVMVACTVLRYLGKNAACVRLHDTGAVVSVHLPDGAEAGVEGYKRLAAITPWRPCAAEVELGQYFQDKHCFDSTHFELKAQAAVQELTTKYRRIKV